MFPSRRYSAGGGQESAAAAVCSNWINGGCPLLSHIQLHACSEKISQQVMGKKKVEFLSLEKNVRTIEYRVISLPVFQFKHIILNCSLSVSVSVSVSSILLNTLPIKSINPLLKVSFFPR